MNTDEPPPQPRESSTLPFTEDDLPLRESDAGPVLSEPPRAAEDRTDAIVARTFLSPPAEPRPERPPRRLPIVAAALAGLIVGAAGGFLFGQRSAPPPVAVADDSQSYTEAPVQTPPTTVTEEPVVQEPEPAAAPPPRKPQPSSAPVRPRRTESPIAVATSGPGSMQVLSRPAGATVFLDGRPLGRTPLTLPEVAPGEHTVRMELAGHGRWSASVTVVPGQRARVAGSLEPN